MNQFIRIHDLDRGRIKVRVPNWVRWMAVDKTGALWFYQHKPISSTNYEAWLELAKHTFSLSDLAGFIKPPKDWKQELYTWR